MLGLQAYVVVKLKLKNPERSCCLLHIHPEPNKIQFLCTNVANMHQKVLCMPRPELDRLFAALGPPVKLPILTSLRWRMPPHLEVWRLAVHDHSSTQSNQITRSPTFEHYPASFGNVARGSGIIAPALFQCCDVFDEYCLAHVKGRLLRSVPSVRAARGNNAFNSTVNHCKPCQCGVFELKLQGPIILHWVPWLKAEAKPCVGGCTLK